MIVLRKSEWALLAFIVIYSLVPALGGLIRVLELAGGPAIAPPNPRALGSPIPITLHILTSIVFCIAGALQFLPNVRRNNPALHRINGRVVAFAGCVSAATGLWMTHAYTFPAGLQGNLLYWVRIVLGSSMIALIVWSVLAIRARDIVGHSAAMLRAYAIGQGASTQTVLGITWIAVTGSEAMGPMRDGIMTFAWALNLLIAQILIRRLTKTGLWKAERSPIHPATYATATVQIEAVNNDPY
ncbi:DUF2306 domain-containing protein [Ahrensia sp. R2A130]|uniref:DUF2306 domain-containing protein n=1 Tax=Ahrensia sp. R2A130 TaxID=744979 RepID=UPI0001E0F853|nr:DUF2306 domain-containing protein [Ahrensia sp. R2A130]EFL89930.1 putative integral membrane protein [Ahrensia sp. R2A130]